MSEHEAKRKEKRKICILGFRGEKDDFFFGIKPIIIVNNKMSLIVRQMMLEVECVYEGEREKHVEAKKI
jgi:hypothetical protein